VFVSTTEVVLVFVSKNVRTFATVAAFGADLTAKVTETESALPPSSKALMLIVAAVVESERAPVSAPVASAVVTLSVPTIACDGATERTPRPNAATATSAMRLNVVFVDICFLSIVDLRNFRRSAWN